MNDKYLTVTALTRYLKYKIESDSNLRTVYLKGEISNFKAHSTGHFYFSIKDENSIIKAIMFKSNASKLGFVPTEGMKVMVTGSSGFIGRHLVKYLIEKNYKVVAIEVDKTDFAYFRDKDLISATSANIGNIVAKNNDRDIILIDLNNSNHVRIIETHHDTDY